MRFILKKLKVHNTNQHNQISIHPLCNPKLPPLPKNTKISQHHRNNTTYNDYRDPKSLLLKTNTALSLLCNSKSSPPPSKTTT